MAYDDSTNYQINGSKNISQCSGDSHHIREDVQDQNDRGTCFYLVSTVAISQQLIQTLPVEDYTDYSETQDCDHEYHGDNSGECDGDNINVIDGVNHAEQILNNNNNDNNDKQNTNYLNLEYKDLLQQILTAEQVSISSGVESGSSSELSLDHPAHRQMYTERLNDFNIDCVGDNLCLYTGNKETCNHSLMYQRNNKKKILGDDLESMAIFRNPPPEIPCCNCCYKQINTLSMSDKQTMTSNQNLSAAPSRLKKTSPRKLRTSSERNNDSPRRDSGISSMGADSPHGITCFSSNLNLRDDEATFPSVFPSTEAMKTYLEGNEKQKVHGKEVLIKTIKESLFSYDMELLLMQLKRKLYESKHKNFSSNETFLSNWMPIKHKTIKSSLKSEKHGNQELMPHISLNGMQKMLPYTTSETAKIITQIQQCIQIINSYFPKLVYKAFPNTTFQLHRKIRLRSFSLGNISKERSYSPRIADLMEQQKKRGENKITRAINNKNKEDRIHESKKLCNLSSQGNIKEILNTLKEKSCDVNIKDKDGYPPLHQAFLNNHFRTVILLLESGTDLEEYTNKRIKEYNKLFKMYSKFKPIT